MGDTDEFRTTTYGSKTELSFAAQTITAHHPDMGQLPFIHHYKTNTFAAYCAELLKCGSKKVTWGDEQDQQPSEPSTTSASPKGNEHVDKRDPVGLYRHLHETLGHPSNSLLWHWATLGLVDKSVLHLDPNDLPKCPACL